MYNTHMEKLLKYRSDNVVVRVCKKKKGKDKYKLVYTSHSLTDCFNFVFGIIRKENKNRMKKEQEQYERFLDFGDVV